MSPAPQNSQPPIPTPGGLNNLTPQPTAVASATPAPDSTSYPSPTIPVFVPIIICVCAILVIIATICKCMSRNAQKRAQIQNQTCIHNIVPTNAFEWVRMDRLETPPPAYSVVGRGKPTTLHHHHWVGSNTSAASAAGGTGSG